MIKVIAIDLIGVLAFEKDIKLTNEEEQLERLFGPNISDNDYIEESNKIINNKDNIINITKNIINKLYYIKDKDIFNKIKDKYPNIILLIATNHISYIKEYINNSFDTSKLDDIIISSQINRIKPNSNFYKYILDKYNILPHELLFIDDNIENIESASTLNINTIIVDKDTNLLKTIIDYLENTK